MKKAKIQVTVKTYFKDGHFRNNRVELTIPEEAAKMISNAWSTLSKESSFLAKNQSADCFVEVGGEVVAGISQMPTRQLTRSGRLKGKMRRKKNERLWNLHRLL